MKEQLLSVDKDVKQWEEPLFCGKGTNWYNHLKDIIQQNGAMSENLMTYLQNRKIHCVVYS